MKRSSMASIKVRRRKDKLMYWLVCLFSFLAMIPLFVILYNVISKGYRNFNINLFTKVTPSSMDALMAKMSSEPIPGEILNGITGSLLIVGMAILFSIPVGLLAGVYLSENQKHRFAKTISFLTDLL
ncbi:MAG: Phosphate transport system permease protein PstA [Bacteroidetes bacterium ADurb.Bin139]|nr:MAG: Phosphate transport system permease protein PstA [Bacteroidetes bacterium ADurb.Bin139]